MFRTLLIGVVAIVVIALAAAFIIPSLIPAEVYRAQIEERASAALGRDVSIDGDVNVAVFPSIQARASGVTIANADGFSAPNLAETEELRARLALLPLLSRRVEIAEFILMRPEITLETNADGTNNWTFTAAGESGGGAAASGAFERRPGALPFEAALGDVRIVEGSARFIDRASGAEHVIADLNASLEMPGLAAPLQVDLSLTLDDDPVRLEARLDSLRSFFDGDASPFWAELRAGTLEVDVDGGFAEGADVAFAGDVRIASNDIRALAASTGATLPDGDVYESFEVSGRASGSADQVAFDDAQIQFDAIRGTGAFAADLSGARPSLSGDLALGALDVTPYIPEGGGPGGSGGGGGGVPPWSEEPIDVSPLRLVDATFNVSVTSLTAGSYRFGESVLAAQLRNGRMQVDIRELNAYEGTGDAQFVLDASGATPQFSMSADLTNIQAQPLLAAAAEFNRLTGLGGARIELSGAGASQADIMRSLNGSGGFEFNNGALQGVNLAAAVRGLNEALQGNLNLDAFRSGASTDFTDLLGQFTVADGVARISDFRLSSPLVRVTGDGALNIGEQSVDVTLEPRAVASIQGQGGATDLSGVGVPIAISGSWGDVSIGVDQQALQRLVAARARDAVADDAGRVIDDALGSDTGALVRGALGLGGGQRAPAAGNGADAAENAAPAEDDAAAAADGESTDDESEEEDVDPAEQLLRGIFQNND